MTKYYYSYNSEGNAYLGKYPALKNPRRQSEYLLPSMATFVEPPETKEKEIAIWNGSSWDVKPDFRGETQINIETRETSKIDYVGNVKDGFQIVSEELAQDILDNFNKYKIIDNKLVDISGTDEYKQYLKNMEIEMRKSEIEKELAEMDSKRIRAICEPSIKDETTGETWLDYYNSQVERLRNELKELYEY